MANKIFPGQFEDEEVLVVFKRHPIVMRKGLIIMMITILIGAFVGMFMSRNTETIGGFLKNFLHQLVTAL